MEEIRCACGEVMKSLGISQAKLSGELTVLPGDSTTVDVEAYECDACGTIAFYRVSPPGAPEGHNG